MRKRPSIEGVKRLSLFALLPAALLFLPMTSCVQVARPDCILVFIDDMGWGDFSCFGNDKVVTENIDRLANEGIRFEQFYVNSPICSPSRNAFYGFEKHPDLAGQAGQWKFLCRYDGIAVELMIWKSTAESRITSQAIISILCRNLNVI
jgi:uncharacterized sulfatase